MKVSAQKLRLHDARNDKVGFLVAALGAFTIATAICNGATQPQDTTEPIWPTKDWQMSTPEQEGMDSTELAKLVDWGVSHSFDSLLVARHGKIVAEAYYAPYTAGIPHEMHSATKAVISTLTAIALKDGLLDNPSHQRCVLAARSSRHFDRGIWIILAASRHGQDWLSVPAQWRVGR